MSLSKILTYLMILILASTAIAQNALNDPYVILGKHFEAMGGLDRLRAEKSYYIDAELSLDGLSGTGKIWIQKPGNSRYEIDLGILKIVQVETAEFNWILDTNGKLQKITNFDQATIDRKKVKALVDDYKYADPNLKTFSISYQGTDTVDGKLCYVIKIKNSINVDELTFYINTENYLLDKSISIEGEQSNDSFYKDYRRIDGLMVAFQTRQIFHLAGQTQALTINEYTSNPEIDPPLFEPPEEKARDYRFTEGASALDIPMRFIENHIFLPVMIDCRETIWILDTGASMSVITKELADRLNLQLEGNMKGAGAGGQVEVSFTTLPSFSLPGLIFDEQTVAVIDLSQLNSILAIQADGILGFDFLSRFVTKVDYARELISFFDPETFEYSGDGREVDLHLKNNLFMVEGSLDGEHSGTWLFDLGASSCSVNGVYAHKYGLDRRKGIESVAHGAGNYFYTKSVEFDSFDLGGFVVDKPRLYFKTGVTDTNFTADEIGSLGNWLFRHFIIFCDYTNERIILEKGADFNERFPYNRSGIRLGRSEGGGYEIIYVSPDTPAEKAGFKEGDVLRRINGIDTDHFAGIVAIRKIFTEKAGTEYKLIVDRDGSEKKLKLKLKELY